MASLWTPLHPFAKCRGVQNGHPLRSLAIGEKYSGCINGTQYRDASLSPFSVPVFACYPVIAEICSLKSLLLLSAKFLSSRKGQLFGFWQCAMHLTSTGLWRSHLNLGHVWMWPAPPFREAPPLPPELGVPPEPIALDRLRMSLVAATCQMHCYIERKWFMRNQSDSNLVCNKGELKCLQIKFTYSGYLGKLFSFLLHFLVVILYSFLK